MAIAFDPTTELRAGNFVLRSWRPADAEQVTQACQDPEVARWTAVPNPYRRVDAEEFIAAGPHRWSASLPSFAILSSNGQELLGSIGFVRSIEDGAVLEIGFWVSAAARGRGLATMSVREVCRWAFTHPHARSTAEPRSTSGSPDCSAPTCEVRAQWKSVTTSTGARCAASVAHPAVRAAT